jgi:tRNA (guanine26-N2/guanine27-N2)-dimethyltransferase
MAIEPLLSLSIDYYIRVFVRVRKSPNDVKLLAGKTMLVYHCDSGCGAWTTQFLARNKAQQNRKGEPFYKHSFAQGPSANEHCEHCGVKTHVSPTLHVQLCRS